MSEYKTKEKPSKTGVDCDGKKLTIAITSQPKRQNPYQEQNELAQPRHQGLDQMPTLVEHWSVDSNSRLASASYSSRGQLYGYCWQAIRMFSASAAAAGFESDTYSSRGSYTDIWGISQCIFSVVGYELHGYFKLLRIFWS